jgi:ATP-dependent helicase YprA (DUF1998 family)
MASNVTNMASTLTWTSLNGIETLNRVVSRCIPQWSNGLHEHQAPPISRVLNKEHVLLFTGTGSGKSALFIVPLIVHRELSQHPNDYPPLRVQENAVAIVITPTKGLANSIVSLNDYLYMFLLLNLC